MADSKLQDLNSGTGVVTPADANFIYMEQSTTAKFCTLTVLVDAYLKAEFNFLENEAGSISIGLTAADSYTSGTNNTSFGVNTLTANTTGSNNTAVGKHALDANVTGNQNTAVGSDAGGAQAGATDDNNTFIGYQAGLLANGSSGGNTAIGASAFDGAMTTGATNTAVGINAMGAATGSATNNVAIGSGALAGVHTVDETTAVGAGALAANTSGTGNTAVGFEALNDVAGAGDDNTAVGHQAGDKLTTADNSVAIGADALGAATTSGDNTAVGAQSLVANTAAGNTAVGYNSLAANVAGTQCVAVGVSAGLTQATAGDIDNTFIGFEAGKVANGSASGANTAVGSQAAVGLTSGINNTVIGNDAAASLTDGDNNIVIGADADCVAGDDNQVSIGTSASRVQFLPGGLFRRSITAGITANAGGGGVGSAVALVSDINQISICGSGNDSVVLPTAVPGYLILVINNGAQTLGVWPHTSDDLGGGVDTLVGLAAGANITYVCYTNALWVAVT